MNIQEAKEVLNRVNNAQRFDGLYTSICIIFEAIEVVLAELDKKDKIINAMGTTMATICTGLVTVREQFEKTYCEFINSDEDCCWKTDKSCKDCIIDYFTKKVSEK